MSWQTDILPASILGATFLLLLGVVEFWTRVARPSPEWPRKVIHLVGGMISLSFPFVLVSPWTVAVLSGGLSLLVVAGKHYGFMRSLHGVKRETRGAEYYPLMIFALFWLAHERPWLYMASLLVLAVADAMAALIGKQYGRLRYQVDEESKTLEGSLTFFVVAFAVIAIPLTLSDDLDLPTIHHRLIVALVAAILVTFFEAVSRYGRDNIWVPLGTYLVLSGLINQPIEEAYAQLSSFAIVCGLLSFTLFASRAVNVGATLALILTVYGCWALTSFDWAIPLFCGIFLCAIVAYWFKPLWPLRAAAILHMVLPIVLAAAMANLSAIAKRESLYQILFAAFLGGCLVIVTQNVWDSVTRNKNFSFARRFMLSVAVSAVVTMTLILPLWMREVVRSAWFAAILFGMAIFVCSLHEQFYSIYPPSTQKNPIMLRRYLTIIVVMLLCACAQYYSIISPLMSR